MIYALFSDVHADSAGLAALKSHSAFQDADTRVCLGDAINAQDIQSAHMSFDAVRNVSDVMVMGNHEAVLVGKCAVEVFSPKVRPALTTAIAYHSEHSSDFVKMLADLPMDVVLGDAVAVHASFDPANPWHHVRYTEDVQAQADTLPKQVNFLAHGHVPFIAWLDGGLWYYERQIYNCTFQVNKYTKYLINTGSVLGSREMRQYEKTFLTYDTATAQVTFYNLGES